MFILSLLWRAAESGHEYFNRIKLTARLPRLRQLVSTGDVGETSGFRTWFARWRALAPSGGPGKLLANPYEGKMGSGPARRVRMYLGSFGNDVHVDDCVANHDRIA